MRLCDRSDHRAGNCGDSALDLQLDHHEQLNHDVAVEGGVGCVIDRRRDQQVAGMSAAVCGDEPQPRMSMRSSGLRLLELRRRCKPRSEQRGCPCKHGHRRKTTAIPVSRDQRDRN